MKGTVVIEKSFDETREFRKQLEDGDFKEFFEEEGDYLDRLVMMAEEWKRRGNSGGRFTVTYTVTVEE